MAPSEEIELKLEVPARRVRDLTNLPLLKRLKPNETKTIRSVYFDTKKGKLHKHGLSLRVRQINHEIVQTIKQRKDRGVGLFERSEWESTINRRRPDLEAAHDTALAPFLDKKLERNLRPVFETRVRRRIFPVDHEDSKIELALDNGQIKAHGRSTRFCEIELELKDGGPEKVFDLARALCKHLPLAPAAQSKAGRGYALAARTPPAPVKAEPITLNAEAAWAKAFQAIARGCLYQLAGNRPAVLLGDTEAIHQMRIGIRRLRAAISLFKEMLSGPQTDTIKAELKWLTGELGPARELDVFMKRVVEPAKKRKANGQAMRPAVEDFRAQCLQSINRAEDAVRSPRFRNLVLDAVAWIAMGDWMHRDDQGSGARVPLFAADGATAELHRLTQGIRKKSAKLVELDTRSRHKLRIKAKKLRYTCEFFAGAFPAAQAAKRRKTFIAKLKDVQDALGDLHDITVHEDLAKTAIQSPNAPDARRGRAAFEAGRLAESESARFGRAMKSAERACRKFAKAKPFWT